MASHEEELDAGWKRKRNLLEDKDLGMDENNEEARHGKALVDETERNLLDEEDLEMDENSDKTRDKKRLVVVAA